MIDRATRLYSEFLLKLKQRDASFILILGFAMLVLISYTFIKLNDGAKRRIKFLRS